MSETASDQTGAKTARALSVIGLFLASFGVALIVVVTIVLAVFCIGGSL